MWLPDPRGALSLLPFLLVALACGGPLGIIPGGELSGEHLYRARAVPVTDPAELEGFDPDRRVQRLELED